ncbi:MAG: PAS domain S-box protein [Chloroflexi bacterium]|nr:PAS domain S-box protein [Chloroflexota bacterium]
METRKSLLRELRQQAKKVYLEEAAEFQEQPVREVQRLIHSLAIELADLEKENEKLVLANADLQEQQSEYASHFDFAPVAYFDLDRDCNVIKANFLASTMLGASRSKLIGMDFSTFIAPQYRHTFDTSCRDLEREGEIQRFEIEMLRKDGTSFYAHLEVVAIYGKAGIIYRMAAQDITEHRLTLRALEESEKRFRSTLDNLREGCVILDSSWRYLYANDASIRFARRTKEQRLGHTMLEVYPGIEKTEAFARLRRCMEQRIANTYETEFTFPEGITAWFEVHVEPVPEGIFVLYLDITERKQKELAKVC